MIAQSLDVTCDYATTDVTDQLAPTLLKMHFTVHTSPTATTSSLVKMEVVRSPVISSAGSHEEWSYFLTRWGDYKDATRIEGKDSIPQLLECCEEDLRRDLTRSTEGNSLTNRTEDEVLSSIKKLAVHEENTMVAGVTLQEMTNGHDEAI